MDRTLFAAGKQLTVKRDAPQRLNGGGLSPPLPCCPPYRLSCILVEQDAAPPQRARRKHISPMLHLQTGRLTLVPFTLERVRAAVYDRAALARLLNAHVPDEWPNPDLGEILPMILEARLKDPAEAAWSALILHTADRALIGDIGFKGGPDAEGTVEIGYGIIPSYRGQGYASEAAQAMIAWAFAQPGVRRVTAECLADNAGSIRVLEKVGMRRTGTKDSEEGQLITWETG